MSETLDAEEFHWPLRVYIEDTDAGGIVYYVNYLKFMERARTELLRTLGFGKAALLNGELMFVVRAVALDYHAPARLDDELLVSARLLSARGAGMSLYQAVSHAGAGAGSVLCDGRVDLACVDRATLRPRRIPPELLSALAAPGAGEVSPRRQRSR